MAVMKVEARRRRSWSSHWRNVDSAHLRYIIHAKHCIRNDDAAVWHHLCILHRQRLLLSAIPPGLTSHMDMHVLNKAARNLIIGQWHINLGNILTRNSYCPGNRNPRSIRGATSDTYRLGHRGQRRRGSTSPNNGRFGNRSQKCSVDEEPST